MSYRIGKLKLKNRYFLAPMLEPNDIAFRLLCKKAGCGLTYTGMISPLSKQKVDLDDKPAIQLFGNSTQGIKEFMKKYDKYVSLWDFNLGCPSELSRRNAHGAFMHKDLKKVEKIVKIIRESTKKPVTIKLRKSQNAISIAKICEKYVDAIGIHPRTISQGYSGEPDYKFALELKKEVKVPVIYSGNVNEKNVQSILKDFDFVFIGREAIGDPNIFYRLIGKKPKLTFLDYLKISEKYKLFFRQIKYQAMVFTKGMKNAKELRRRIISSKSQNDLFEIMKTNK